MKPKAIIDCDRNENNYIAYLCPNCGRRFGKNAKGCSECGITFDWSQRAKIIVTREVIWE